MSDGMGRELAYLSSHATNRYFYPELGYCLKENIRITPTEMSVLVLAKGGWPIKLIALRMNVSIATVKTYRARAFKKLGVTSITEALAVMENYHWG